MMQACKLCSSRFFRFLTSLADLNSIASLPSKEELIAKLLFLLNAPAQRIAVATNGVARNLAVVLKQAVEQNKFS